MKIATSNVTMASSHHEYSYSHKETATIEAAASKNMAGVIVSLSKQTSGDYLESMQLYKKQEKEEAKRQKEQNELNSFKDMMKQIRTSNENNQYEIKDELDMKIKMLRQILAMLRGEKLDPEELKEMKSQECRKSAQSAGSFKLSESADAGVVVLVGNGAASSSAKSGNAAVVGNASSAMSRSTVWQRITASSGTYVESESTSFAATGTAKTLDGRSLEFGIEVSMSRAFMCEFNSLETSEYIKTDPLVINLDSNVASVSDQKFFFDLDSDGKEEEVSFAVEGSGFLALDKDNDGKINDGSELFGTKSGDGFKDLAAFDDDGNGWIDENDSIFKRLKVWTKDSNGKDYLIDLKQADVGAIYLGNVDTQYSLKDNEHRLNAEIKKTGIYLKESTGAVGTVNHVDLAL